MDVISSIVGFFEGFPWDAALQAIGGLSIVAAATALDFDPTKWGALALYLNPFRDTARERALGNEANAAIKSAFRDAPLQDSPADAARHFLWSYKMARELGAERAKRFADGWEISSPNPEGSRLMDLYNNERGRLAAFDPRNSDRSAMEVALETLNRRQLQTQPFAVRESSDTIGGWPYAVRDWAYRRIPFR